MNIAQYIGRKYSVPDCDCWSLIREFSIKELGRWMPQYMYSIDHNESDAAVLMHTETALGANWVRVSSEELEAGDVILFRIKGAVCHAGLYIGNGDFLHTLKGRNSALENLRDGNWRQRIFGFFRYHNGN